MEEIGHPVLKDGCLRVLNGMTHQLEMEYSMIKQQPETPEQSRLDSFQPTCSLEINAELYAELNRCCYGNSRNVRLVAEIAISTYLHENGYGNHRSVEFYELKRIEDDCEHQFKQSEYSRWRRDNPDSSDSVPI